MESIVYLFFLIIFIATIGSKIFGKLCCNLVAYGSVSNYAFYQIMSGTVACIFFFISGGFKLQINLPTVIYSVIFALIVAVSVISLAAYRLTNISMVTILSSTMSIIGTSLLGALVFSETIDLRTILRIVIMLVAVVLTFLDREKTQNADTEKTDKKKGLTKRAIFLLAIIMLISLFCNASSTIITKFYALDTRVVDENSFFFFTNVALVTIAAIAFAIDGILHHDHFRSAITMLNPWKTITLAGNTVCSNVVSLIGVPLLALIDVSVYTPIMSALGIISGVVASLLFREKLGVLSYVAAAVACVTVVL